MSLREPSWLYSATMNSRVFLVLEVFVLKVDEANMEIELVSCAEKE